MLVWCIGILLQDYCSSRRSCDDIEDDGIFSSLSEVLTVLQLLYKLGTSEQGEPLSLTPEDFHCHKLINKISRQLRVCQCIHLQSCFIVVYVTRTPLCYAVVLYLHGVVLCAHNNQCLYHMVFDKICLHPLPLVYQGNHYVMYICVYVCDFFYSTSVLFYIFSTKKS